MNTFMTRLGAGVFRFRIRTLFIAVTILSMVVAYGTAYHRISRRGMAEATEYGLSGFLYVPAEEVFAAEDLSRHHLMAMLFAPANWVDQQFFGGPPPVGCIMFRLA